MTKKATPAAVSGNWSEGATWTPKRIEDLPAGLHHADGVTIEKVESGEAEDEG